MRILKKTVALVEYCKFDSSYIFKYSPRPGTPAAEMEDNVSKEVKKTRFLALEQVQKSISSSALNDCIGKTKEVLVEKTFGKG